MNKKNAILSILLLFFISLEIVFAFNHVHQESKIKQQRAVAYDAIINLQSQIGFSGLIQKLKSALLESSQENYSQQAQVDYQLALVQVDLLEAAAKSILGDLNMVETRKMLSAFTQRIDTLSMISPNEITAQDIDTLFVYNDIPARNEIKQVFEAISFALEKQSSDLIYNSIRLSVAGLLALFITLFFMIRFFFSQQQNALRDSAELNAKLEQNHKDIEDINTVLVNAVRDIQHEKQESIWLNNELSTKNKEMEQFIYTVSHDLKSPLVTIGAFTNSLINELDQVLTDKQRHRFNRISENISNMESLLNDLLDLSKIVQQSVEKTYINVKSLVEVQCGQVEEEFSASGATLHIAEELSEIYANERLLSQVIANLLTNSIRYRSPSRPLEIEISTTANAESVTLNFKDNGSGIDAKYHQRVFDIFERLSSVEGTGVGLTIVRTIMEKHGGEVTIESSLDKGACFSLTFPNPQSNQAYQS